MRGTVAILTLTLSLCLCFASNQSQAAPGPAIDSAIPQPDSSETVNTGSESPRPEHPLRTDAQSPAPMESAPERKADPRAERGLTSMSNQFVPRGQWIFGASASYSTHTNKDYTFLVIEDINSDGYTFKVTPLIDRTGNIIALLRSVFRRRAVSFPDTPRSKITPQCDA